MSTNQTFAQFLENELNGPQREAVKQHEGALLVVAGAGSGKTRVITARMANLILEQRADPYSIVALTFTNKAAGEMKERLMQFLLQHSHEGIEIPLPFVGTFHSYALLLLRSNPSLLPFSDFSIMDTNDQKTLLKQIIKKHNLEKQFTPTKLIYQISRIKNHIKVDEQTYKTPLIRELHLAYETEKTAAHCFDFDDLLIMVLKLFQDNKEFKRRFQAKVKHLLVDEYQDTNGVQHELLKEMALDQELKCVAHSLCAVGDQDQSIYSWRGAMVTNMLSFQKDFAPVTMVKIEQNYRSVQPILKGANAVIENNKERHPKKLWSDRKAKNRILGMTCQSGYHEADTIATYIKSLPKKKSLKDVAILYRTHFQSRSIEEALIKSAIPYVIIGGIRFYERKEIKDLLAYMRLIANPFDRASLFRIINIPARGLGAKFEELLYDEWNKNPFLNFHQLLTLLTKQVTKIKAASLTDFLSTFQGLEKKEKPATLLARILEKSGYLSYLRNAFSEQEAETKIENIQEFARSIEQATTLTTFLHEIALLQEKLDNKAQEQTDYVQMMTLHAVKGLEFDTVVIAGLEEGLLPSSKSLSEAQAIEEERRLFYVGMTRAKEWLILTRALYRNSYGQMVDQPTSRFLAEIPSSLMHQIDLSRIHPAQTPRLIAEWQGTPVQPSVQTFSLARRSVPKKKLKRKTTSQNHPWKKNQVVQHKAFGAGVIKKIEKISDDKYYLTIFFKSGEKTISSKFVQ